MTISCYGRIEKIEITNIQGVHFHDATQAEIDEGYHGDGEGGTTWCHDWYGVQSVNISNVQFAKERLLELTVADQNNPANFKTAIDSAIQQLYLPEDQDTHTAEIDIDALFYPDDCGDDIYLTVTRSDGYTPISDYLGGGSTYNQTPTLAVTNLGREYVIRAWVDADHDQNLDAGEDYRQVNVHVAKPWTAQGTWTMGNASFVKANADGASLADLARDITGNAADASALGSVGKITKDKQIDVTPLLKVLEDRIRDQVVAAAGSILNTVTFAESAAHITPLLGKKSATVLDFFNAEKGIVTDCGGAALAASAKGLIDVIGTQAFDVLYTTATIPWKDHNVGYGGASRGDWGMIFNNGTYASTRRNGKLGGAVQIRKCDMHGIRRVLWFPHWQPVARRVARRVERSIQRRAR